MFNNKLNLVFSRLATIALVMCCLAMTGLVVRRELFTSRASAEPVWKQQPDWRDYTTSGYRIGPESAPVVLVEFGDYQCPACMQLESVIRETRRRFPDQFAFVYRHYPLPSHPFARDAAIASECAARQQQFPQMHSALFDNQRALGTMPWDKLAESAGVPDIRSFGSCMRDSTIASTIDLDIEAGKKLKVNGTPTFLINGRRWTGTLPQATLDSLVKAIIAGR
jgi:protein-disulfide isomerase